MTLVFKNVLSYSLIMISMLIVGCGSLPQQGVSPMVYKEVNVETRNAEAARVLKGSKNLILVYARGLCCPSCSLGVRKTMSRLSFVDIEQPKKGVILDAKHQLVHVLLKPGAEVVTDDIWQAIDDAGYDPVTIYRNTASGVETEQYKSEP